VIDQENLSPTLRERAVSMDEDVTEFAVPVHWQVRREVSNAVAERGLFASQVTACKLRDRAHNRGGDDRVRPPGRLILLETAGTRMLHDLEGNEMPNCAVGQPDVRAGRRSPRLRKGRGICTSSG
jgi:hypothetical protein